MIGPGEEVEVYPLSGIEVLSEAARAWRAGGLLCLRPLRVRGAELRAPADGAPPFGPLELPALGIVPGDMASGAEAEARFARLFDLATIKGEAGAIAPLWAEPARVARVEGGVTLEVPLDARVLGRVGRVYGPIVVLTGDEGGAAPGAGVGQGGATAGREPAPLLEEPAEEAGAHRGAGSLLLSASTELRLALDDREGTLGVGDRLRGASPGLGAIDRPLILPAARPPPADDALLRALVAHGLATGLPLVSIGLSSLNTSPECVTLCSRDGQVLPPDRAFFDELAAQTPEALSSAGETLAALELATYAAAFATVLIPTGRRGVLGRFELVEDAWIIGESILVSAATPLWLQARVGRMRPIALHPAASPGREGRAAVTAPFVAPKTAFASAAASAAVTLLFVEEAGEGWVVPAIAALGALATGVGVYELRSGEVAPSDLPLGALQGVVSGAGVVLWHRIFWRGWPGDARRADLPLRLRGVELELLPGGAMIGARGEL